MQVNHYGVGKEDICQRLQDEGKDVHVEEVAGRDVLLRVFNVFSNELSRWNSIIVDILRETIEWSFIVCYEEA